VGRPTTRPQENLAMPIKLEIVTPAGAKVQADVAQVTAPGTVGEIGILPGHRALITSLGIGPLSYTPAEGGESRWLAVNTGYLEVSHDHCIVVTETAEAPEEIDMDRAEEALRRAGQRIAELGSTGSKEALKFSLEAKQRAEVRLAVAKKAKNAPPPM